MTKHLIPMIVILPTIVCDHQPVFRINKKQKLWVTSGKVQPKNLVSGQLHFFLPGGGGGGEVHLRSYR